jgi:serine/threonine protein kinase
MFPPLSQSLILYFSINIENIDLGEVIGEGAWGCVRIAQHKYTKRHYAVKIMSKYGLIKQRQADHAKNEKEIFESLDHPFIVKLNAFEQDSKCIYLIQEFVRGGEFLTLLKQKKRLEVDVARFFAGQIMLTFGHLHSLNIIYRDLKPENMLVDKTGYLKVIDFGLSKKIYDKTYTVCGTPHYIAPEVLTQGGYSFEADWYTLGVVLYEMIIGAPPFDAETHKELFSSIIHDKVRFPKDIDSDVKTVISGLLRKDPNKRYGFKKLLKQEFFQNIDLKLLKKKELEPPFFPSVKKEGDTSNFKKIKIAMLNEENCPPISREDDIFLDW